MPPQRRAAKPGTKTTRARRARKQPPRTTKKRRPHEPPNKKPTVAVVGAGRVGAALAVALERRGYAVAALVSRTREHARRSARLLASRPLALGADELHKIPESGVLIVAVPDDQIAVTAASLALPTRSDAPARERVARAPRRVALHASGALSSGALAPLRARGFAVGSLHPLVSVADAASGADALRGAFFCVEGDARALHVARRIVGDLGGQSFSVAAEDKALYHAAAVFAAGHAAALFEVATRLLAVCGVRRRLARRALHKLTESALANVLRSPQGSVVMTGPFARGDFETVRKQIAAFEARGLGADLRLYLELGRRALEMTAGGMTKDRARLLEEIGRALAKLGV